MISNLSYTYNIMGFTKIMCLTIIANLYNFIIPYLLQCILHGIIMTVFITAAFITAAFITAGINMADCSPPYFFKCYIFFKGKFLAF